MTRTTDILVVGAGPTGLGAAWRLDQLGHADWLLCEASSHAGGLAGSEVDAHGFTWDFGGHVQFSHYDYFDELMDDLLGDDGWYYHDRESWVRLGDRFIPYPFQLNVHRLPEDEGIRAVVGLIHASRRATGAAPTNFGEWIDATFGPGLSSLFMRPYNAKVWARPPERMSWSWIGDRVALVDLPRVVENLRLSRDDVSWGPNNRFRFPKRGGTGVIWRTLARRLESRHREKFLWGARLTRLDTSSHRAVFSNGDEVQYARLLSTAPLDEVVRMSDLPSECVARVEDLEYSSTHVVGIGLRGRPNAALARKCWMYFPEATSPFYRVTHFSLYSPHNVAYPDHQWSLMAEVSESPWKPIPVDVVEDTINGLAATGLVADRSAVHHTWCRRLEHGYPVPSLTRDDVLSVVLPALESRDVLSRGRFGAWKYEVSNQDHSFGQGVEAIDRWLRGGIEETFLHPDRVNARRPAARAKC